MIPPHQRAMVLREYDQWLYLERHLIECFINKIKHFQRIFSRFDKLDGSNLTSVQDKIIIEGQTRKVYLKRWLN